MESRVTTTITLSPTAQNMLTLVALKQLRSRSHAIEALIREAYEKIREEKTTTIKNEGAGQ